MESKKASQPLWQRVVAELEKGVSVPIAAQNCQTSEDFVQAVLSHLVRIGRAGSADSLCSSGMGACHHEDPSAPTHAQLMPIARLHTDPSLIAVHCAGCPLAVRT